jgi:hypothetical protein
MRAPPDQNRHALMACVLHTRAMAVTDEGVRLRLASLHRTEPPTEQHVPKARRWDITRGHPPLLAPPSVAFHLKVRILLPSLVLQPQETLSWT